MAKEEFKYTVDRSGDSMYHVVIERKLHGEWREVHKELTHTMWGGKRRAVRWIKNWSKGKYRQRSYMNIVSVDRKWLNG